MAYSWFKAFHIVGVVVWFAGLFYLARLFIYHVEANQEAEPARTILKKQYGIMEKRLYGIITTPGMLVTVAMAIGLLVTEPEYLKQTWMHVKLSLVVLLLGYHHYCKRIMRQLEEDTCKWTSQQLRAFNEFPTVILVVVVMLVVFKNALPTDLTAWVVFGLIIAMAASIQLYAKKRRLDKEKELAQLSQVPQEQG